MERPDVFNFSKICSVLPQRSPMLLVDRVESMTPGRSIVGLKAITATEGCYSELADDSPLSRYAYPQSLLVESFGQTAAILWLLSTQLLHTGSDRVLMFAALRDFEVEGQAYPGDVLHHRVQLEKATTDTVVVSGETRVGERRIATVGCMVAVARDRSEVMSQGRATQEVPGQSGQTAENLLS
jgi:3-hydroxyacyl-[acyl-carrier-protein] dehydratase